jgi:hypothetical protein
MGSRWRGCERRRVRWHRRTWWLGGLFSVVFVVLGVFAPAKASAFATIEGPPTFSSASGLSDGRVYELVSPVPPEKNGNQAGATTSIFDSGGLQRYGLVSPDGESVLFEGTGPMGESPWAASLWFVATKGKSGVGWSTRALLPAGQQSLAEVGGLLHVKNIFLLHPSRDLSHAMVEPGETLAPQANDESCHSQLYLTGPDPFVAATWLAKADVASPVRNCAVRAAGAPAGGSPDFSTVYFTYPGTLLPEDASRAPHTGTGDPVEAWGFYEDREGTLHEAGVLPNGELDPYGAVPAASAHGTNRVGNEVSTDGSRAFFVSPDPASCAQNGGHNACGTDPSELYVREDGERTLLVSRDPRMPEAEGLPAAAPDGVLAMRNSTVQETQAAANEAKGSYVFASPDGSQAFFQSTDALTEAAEQAGSGSEPKTYDFDVDTDTLYYLPGVVGELLATDTDGSSLAFVRPEEGGAAAELELWSAGPEGPGDGGVTPIVQLSGEPSSGEVEYVSDAQMSSDGSALAFVTATSLSSVFNSGGDEQVYRYDVPADTLGCVSCAPAGVAPGGNAWMSVLRAGETFEKLEVTRGTVEDLAISSDGQRIFFDSPAPLVNEDSNTNSPEELVKETQAATQGRDVYEWENGVVYLISTGKSDRNSYLIGSSESGDDVFFSTAEGLVPEDTDGGYDIYDARVPELGESRPAAAAPCEGSACEGPTSSPAPATSPLSATFTGLGNPLPETTPAPVAPPTTITKKAVKCKRGYVKKKNKCVQARKSAKKVSHASHRRSAGQ